MEMTEDKIKDLYQKIRKAVSGQGIYGKNREIRMYKDTLWNKYWVGSDDITHNTFVRIIGKKLLNNLEPGRSLSWFITGVVHNVVREMTRREDIEHEHRDALKGKEKFEGQIIEPDFDAPIIPPPVLNPEEMVLRKEIMLLASKVFSDTEIEVLTGRMRLVDYAKENGMTCGSAKTMFHRKKRCLRKVLVDAGYESISDFFHF